MVVSGRSRVLRRGRGWKSGLAVARTHAMKVGEHGAGRVRVRHTDGGKAG